MFESYLCVVEDKKRNVINKTELYCDLNNAKNLMNILMHQTSVRYGYLLEATSDSFGNIEYNKKIYDTVIIHEGE